MRAAISVAVLLAAFLYQTLAFGTPVEVSRAEDVGMSSERLTYLKSYFEGMLEDEETGGFQILISRRGKIVMYENLGLPNVEENIPDLPYRGDVYRDLFHRLVRAAIIE